ncbi:uncharacterized protein LOC123018294 isoform X2 [Varanus komodoensis]|uniref:uncharacterized protein LOC123018294 isoform X2 n=1 Tax=Varanus komodoensis TaxID=61221 RepID=UPI001CF7C71B|nr:uncharacterized protein LOC123018294 isoform X2 [Varanus komodoensis]
MSPKDVSSWSRCCTGQMFRPSRMFGWHPLFTVRAQWKKGEKIPPLDSSVVLTNVKTINSEKSIDQGLIPYPPAMPDSSEDPGAPKPSNLPEHQASSPVPGAAPLRAEHLVSLSGLHSLTVKGQNPRLARCEPEGVCAERPGGASSQRAPKVSGQSFVLHSRGSSCDSGVLSSSSSPVAEHSMRMCKDIAGSDLHSSSREQPVQCLTGQPSALRDSLEEDAGCPESKNPDPSFFGGARGRCSEGKTGGAVPASLLPAEEQKPSGEDGGGRLEELPLPGHPLRKHPTSDSLDAYMDECCRLSQVNQGNAKKRSSGLGYLEHICQLIEKIGQLQEHNLKLQKEIGSLQKVHKTSQLNEEYFLQQCSCGAASMLLSSSQELKNPLPGWRRPCSLLVQNGNVSDLSIIPEIGRRNEQSREGGSVHQNQENNQLIIELKLSNVRKTGEKEWREGCSVSDGPSYLSKELALKRHENRAWGSMRDLLRKTRGKNESRPGLPSAALERSCPQLYRPDSVCVNLGKAERNSMIALRQSSGHESDWPS